MIQYSGYQYHAASGDSFDSIALEIYGDESFAPDLMNANPDLCGQAVFRGGETLLLPQLYAPEKNEEAAMANTLAPWKT